MHEIASNAAWRPMARARLGIEWGNLFGDVVSGGLDIWKAREEEKAAEELRKAAQAKAAAAKAAAEEAAKLQEIVAKQEETTSKDTILGVDKDIVLYGALGLAALAGAFLIFRS